MNEYPDRIPYEAWSNSQLSIVRFSGSCISEIVDGEKLYKPDLVRVKK